MAENKPTSKITHIIFDLDGLILGELEKLVQSFIKMFFFFIGMVITVASSLNLGTKLARY